MLRDFLYGVQDNIEMKYFQPRNGKLVSYTTSAPSLLRVMSSYLDQELW